MGRPLRSWLDGQKQQWILVRRRSRPVRFDFDEDQQSLRQVVGEFLDGLDHRRRLIDGEDPSAIDGWSQAAQLGLLGVNAREELGGLDLGPIALSGLLEVMGEKLWCGPYLSSIGMGLEALSLANERLWVESIIAGDLQASLALVESEGPPDLAGLHCTARRQKLLGTKGYVLHGETAGLFLVVAREESGNPALYAVEAASPGLSLEPCATMDSSRPLALLSFEETPSLRMGGADLVEQLLDRAALYAAAESLGGAQACMDMAVSYAKDREQFGRPIGSFQAIQHHCAEMLLKVESARSAVYSAAWIAEHRPDDLSMAAAMAKATASEAYFFCAGSCIQVLGGIAITWEHPAHLYFKRAQGDRLLLGDPAFQRRRFAAHGGLQRPLVESA